MADDTENPSAEPVDNDMIRTVTLDAPVRRGRQKIAEVQVRKPGAGELRGVSLVDLGQLKVDALITVIPRVTIPPLTAQEAAALEPADLLAIGAEFGSFLLPKRDRMAARAQ